MPTPAAILIPRNNTVRLVFVARILPMVLPTGEAPPVPILIATVAVAAPALIPYTVDVPV